MKAICISRAHDRILISSRMVTIPAPEQVKILLDNLEDRLSEEFEEEDLQCLAMARYDTVWKLKGVTLADLVDDGLPAAAARLIPGLSTSPAGALLLIAKQPIQARECSRIHLLHQISQACARYLTFQASTCLVE